MRVIGTNRHPLNPYQRDLWTASCYWPQDPQFNSAMTERVTGPMDQDLLRRCAERALRRTDGFHLRFGQREGVPHQWAEWDLPPVEIVDFSAEPDPRAASRAWTQRLLSVPYQLDGGRMAEVVLLRESDEVISVCVKAHHMVADGWALTGILNQIFNDYAHTLRTGSHPEIHVPSFLDVLAAEEPYAGTEAQAAEGARLLDALADAEPALFARKQPSGSRASRTHAFSIEAKTLERVRENGVTRFSYLAASLAGYLARVHGTDEVCLGVPLLNRQDDSRLATAGHFANTLPLRVRTDPDSSVLDLARRIRGESQLLKSAERYPLGRLLHDLQAGDDQPKRMYDTIFSMLRFPAAAQIPGTHREVTALVYAQDQNALVINARHRDDGSDLEFTLDYAPDVFDEDFPIENVARHLKNLITGGLDEPDQPVWNLPMLEPAEHDELVHARNATAAEFPQDQTVHGLFARQAARTPTLPALADAADGGAFPLDYGALDRRAERIAGALRQRGVGPGSRVAVLLERGPDTVAALLGVLKAGGAYVPVDPTLPEARVAYLLQDSGAEVVLTSGGTDRLPVPELGCDLATLDEPSAHPAADAQQQTAPPEFAAPASAGDGVSAAHAGPEDPAYVIYTSGSTGQPKGVVVEHRSVVNRLSWMQDRYPIGPDDVLLQKTPTFFDVSVWELFWGGITGAKLVTLPSGLERDPRELHRVLTEQRVTTVHFVPSMFGPWLEMLEEQPRLVDSVRALRQVFCSGEALPTAQVDLFHRLFSRRGSASVPRLVNLYGPTEATVDVTYHDCLPDEGRTAPTAPIGKPIHNTQLYVLGRNGQPQPQGAPGELCVAGANVARGYLGRPELTDERFTDNPLVPGGRMYRTGDLARWLADGGLEYLGRTDAQVKVNGWRVEPEEVRAVLARCPGVREAAVDARRDPAGRTRLAGYYVADSDIPAAQLHTGCAEALPTALIPAHFVRVERMPLTPGGKTDLRALPDPDGAADPAVDADGEPQSPTEEALRDIWSEVLGVESPGVHDNYYALGGDSIQLLRIRAKAERRGIGFDLSDMVRFPSIAALAPHTTHTEPAGPHQEEGPDGPDGRTRAEGAGTAAGTGPFALLSAAERATLTGAVDAHPLTRLQLGMVYHSLERPSSSVYRDVFRYGFDTDWDEDAFRAAFARLTARHPALRSAFELAGVQQPLQVVYPEVSGALEISDLRAEEPSERERLMDAHIAQYRFHAYDFGQPPLYHFRAFVTPGDHGDPDVPGHSDDSGRSGDPEAGGAPVRLRLVFSFHHALLDGWSVANLVGELMRDYLHALGAAVEPPDRHQLPTLAQHVIDERAALDSAESRGYWRELLQGAEPTEPLADRPHTAPAESGPVHSAVRVPEEVHSALRELTSSHGVPLKSALLAAHCLTLRLFSGSRSVEVTTGAVTHGRPDHEDADTLTGLLLNTVPVRLDGRRRGWLETAQELLRQEREGYPHRRVPLSTIQEDHGRPVARTAFNFAHFHSFAPLLAVPDFAFASFEAWEETNFALLVNAFQHPAGDRLDIRVEGDGRLFTPERLEVYARAYLNILTRLATRPQETVDFGFLAEEPTALPSSGWQSTVLDLFAAQVARVPDATAVAFGDDRRSYRELDRHAERIARSLVRRGVVPEDRVGIALDRSFGMVAAVLGVLRAGAACVPLDTTYPAERLATMVERTAPAAVIAEAGAAPPWLRDHGLLMTPTAGDTADSEAGHTAGGDGPQAPLPVVTPDSTVFVLFTSGSTGGPKGVAMPHSGLTRLIEWQLRDAGGEVDGETLQFAPLSFDVSFHEIFTTLGAGRTLRLVTDEQRRDPRALLGILDECAVERVFLPYVALHQLAETAVRLDLIPRWLRVIQSSGEQLRITPQIREFYARLHRPLLLNHYGPTETHVVTRLALDGPAAELPELPPIGTPAGDSEVLLLDDRLRPVPEGTLGEIYLGGDCLADGYEGDPERTGERFVSHPYGPPGYRLYRSGDLGYLLPDGSIVCAGRVDRQHKVRGHRVEPAEVEAALREAAADQPGVTEAAVVVGGGGEGGDAFLAGFLVGAPHQAPDGATGATARDADGADPSDAFLNRVRAALRSKLPDYLLPSSVTLVPRLPLTPSGKRDDSALLSLVRQRRAGGRRVLARDDAERAVADVLTELLDLEEIGVDEDVFDLGCTSLTAVRIVTVLEERTGVNLPLPLLVQAPTVERIAERVRSGGSDAHAEPLVTIRAEGTQAPLFLVHPIGGSVLCYRRLAAHLPPGRPVYGVQATGGTEDGAPPETMEEVAARYLRTLRAAQPNGPYVLSGWSFGGLVAFEMARQLRLAGEEVSSLVLIDPIALRPGERQEVDEDALLRWFFWELLLVQRGSETEMSPLPEGLTSDEDKTRYMARVARQSGALPEGMGSRAVHELYLTFRANWRAMVTYQPHGTDLDLVLMRGVDDLPEVLRPIHDRMGTQHRDAANGWGHWTSGRIDVVEVEGDHLTMMEEPRVRGLAERIGARLAPDSPPPGAAAPADPTARSESTERTEGAD